MTRINTNVGSLVGRNNLQRANASLSQSLTRLSTGLRINTGKDDPAGLIASENLRSDITAIKKAISNTDRANQVIATADSALGQVSSLLNDIRGLVTESANSGALSDEQISANQLQVDSSLEALNRIAQTTTFQGRRLLDGSLDFITSPGTNFNNLSDLQVDQANLGATGQIAVDIDVSTAATRAQIDVGGIAASVAGTTSTGTISFADSNVAATADATFTFETSAATAAQSLAQTITNETAVDLQSTFSLDLDADLGTTTSGPTITIQAASGNGTAGDLTFNFIDGGASGAAAAVYNGGSGEVDVTVFDDTTVADLEAALAGTFNGVAYTATTNNSADTTALSALGGDAANDLAGGTFAASGGQDQVLEATRTLTFASANTGAGRDFQVQFAEDTQANIDAATGGTGDIVSVTGTATSGYTITVANDTSVNLTTLASDIQTQINAIGGDGQGGNVSVTLGGSGSTTLSLANPNSALPAGVVDVNNSSDAATETVTLGITAETSEGATPNGVNLTFDNTAATLSGNPVDVSGSISTGFTVAIDSTTATFQNIIDALEAETGVASVTYATDGALANTANINTAAAGSTAISASQGNTSLADGRDAGIDVIEITANSQDAAFDANLTVALSTLGNPVVSATGVDASVDGNGDISILIDSSRSLNIADIASAISDQLTDYSAAVTATSDGSGTFDGTDSNDGGGVGQDPTASASVTGGAASTGGLLRDAVIELSGALGSEVFNLQAGTDIATLEAQINLVSDATGVIATANGTTLELQSSEYGSGAFVDVTVRDEASDGTFTTAFSGDPGDRAVGTDIEATVNGVQATGNGNELSINTATLDLTTTVAADTTGTSSFTITGGGALFQLGPDVVSNQQARLGISSVNTAALGGVSGSLYQLASGGTADLSADPTTAAAIVEEAIDQVTSLRGRLGAFQRTTLETNKNALNDTLSNLTEAESSIRDADFAEETASLTRSQILVQSGTRVLAIANQNPQNVLGLLG